MTQETSTTTFFGPFLVVEKVVQFVAVRREEAVLVVLVVVSAGVGVVAYLWNR